MNPLDPSSFANIVIRVPNWLGDAVMCLPALQDIRDHYPLAKVTVLARPIVADLLAGQPVVDQILVFDHQGKHKGLSGLVNLIVMIRERQFDLAVLFQNAFQAAFIAACAGIPCRVGYSRDGRGWLLSRSLDPKEARAKHQIHYYQQLAEKVTQHTYSERAPKLVMSQQEQEDCEKRFSLFSHSTGKYFIGMNPGSVYGSAKRWLPERFAKLGDELVQALTREFPGISEVQCMVFGGKGEERLARQISEMMRQPPLVLTGKTNIRELMALLGRCLILVTNDTGPMHIAQALGVPVTAIFGPTDPGATSPYGKSHGVVRSPVRCSPCLLRTCPIDHRCMTQISVEQVKQQAMNQIRAFHQFPLHVS